MGWRGGEKKVFSSWVFKIVCVWGEGKEGWLSPLKCAKTGISVLYYTTMYRDAKEEKKNLLFFSPWQKKTRTSVKKKYAFLSFFAICLQEGFLCLLCEKCKGIMRREKKSRKKLRKYATPRYPYLLLYQTVVFFFVCVIALL